MTRQISSICFKVEMKKMADEAPSILGWRCYQPGDLNPQLNSFDSHDLLSNSALASYSSNSMSSIGEALGRSIRPNITRGVKASSIRAVVLGGYVIEGQEAISYNMSVVPANRGSFANRVQMLYIRVPELTHLPDPHCSDNSFNSAQTVAVVEMHPIAAVPNWVSIQPTVAAGSIVEVEFTEGFSRGIVKKILDEATDLQLALQEMTASGAFFAGGNGIFLNLPVQTPAEVKECAESYDSPPPPKAFVPNASQHTSFFTTLHPEFLPYVKCFLWRCWDELGAQIQLNSSYRSLEKQQQLRDAYIARGKTGLPASSPGSSHHNFGWAIDFNPILKDGTKLMSSKTKNPKAQWEASGIVQLGESVGLRWGGNFSNYDPIHFDGGKLLTESTSQLLVRARAENVAGNQLQVTLKV